MLKGAQCRYPAPQDTEKDLSLKKGDMGPETNKGSFLDRVAGKARKRGGEEVMWAKVGTIRGLALQGAVLIASFYWVLWIPLYTSGFELMNLECAIFSCSPAFDSSCPAWMSFLLGPAGSLFLNIILLQCN